MVRENPVRAAVKGIPQMARKAENRHSVGKDSKRKAAHSETDRNLTVQDARTSHSVKMETKELAGIPNLAENPLEADPEDALASLDANSAAGHLGKNRSAENRKAENTDQ